MKRKYIIILGIQNIIIRSLVNLGCTCYLSTVIQLLFHILEFRNDIINLDIKKENNNALFSLKNLFNDMIMYYKDRKYIKPIFLLIIMINKLLIFIIKKMPLNF